MNLKQRQRRDHVREWGRCGRPFVTHLLNDAVDAAWCGKQFGMADKIAAHENSLTCNDCQILAAAPRYERNKRQPGPTARRVKRGFETRAQIDVPEDQARRA